MDITISKEETVNDLNSLLIEGTLTDDPTPQEYDGVVEYCTFTIASHRITSTETRETVLPVRVCGTLGANCAEYLRKGRQVRIVGSIAGDAESLTVIAEHVEFRPMKREPTATAVASAPYAFVKEGVTSIYVPEPMIAMPESCLPVNMICVTCIVMNIAGVLRNRTPKSYYRVNPDE